MFRIALLMTLAAAQAGAETRIIAHRGASAYLPEHTREAYMLAYGFGADFLEPDLVMSADGVLLALHDVTLEATTDVFEVFPDRAREDGRFYVMDFTWAELEQLQVYERVDPLTGLRRFPDRWPRGKGQFRLTSFDELLELTAELNRMTGRAVGVYPEIKFPRLHADKGLDITAALVDALERHGLPRADFPVFIQCFRPGPLKRIRASHGDRFALVQLIGENEWAMNDIDYDAMREPEALREIATYADGIGPPFDRLIEPKVGGEIEVTEMFRVARELGLEIHPFTFRRESMPEGVALEDLLGLFMHELKVEALFTDHTDVAVRVRDSR